MNVTRGEQMLALRRAREAASPPILRGGFRPFFLGAAAWAATAPLVWLLVLGGSLDLPTHFAPLAWHRHEMVFGFVGAAMSGFLLTAVPNWTGRLPVAGGPLAALFGLWLAARLALLGSELVGAWLAVLLDVGYFLLLAALAAREVRGIAHRNAPLVGLVLLFGLAAGLDHAAAAGWLADDGLGTRAGIALVAMMISLVGGRIIPSFTRNWLARQGVKAAALGQPTAYDRLVLAATAAALIGWLAFPDRRATAILFLAAAALQIVRLMRWQGWRAAREPFVLILHLGYLWLAVGLALLGASLWSDALPPAAALHALGAGAMATMILGVMTRSALSFTARPLRAGAATILIFLLVTIGALLRVTAPFLDLDPLPILRAAGLAWTGAFLLFLLAYGPVLAAPRQGPE